MEKPSVLPHFGRFWAIETIKGSTPAAFDSHCLAYAIIIVRAHVRGLGDQISAFRSIGRRRCVRIRHSTRRYYDLIHQTRRLEVHHLSCWFLIHFHKSIIITFLKSAAKVRQIFDICKFLPYFLHQNDYFTSFPVASNSFSPRRMKI